MPKNSTSELLRALGQDNLDRLSIAAGGARFLVPKHFGVPPTGGHDSSKRLVQLVGKDIALLLIYYFGDSRIYIPKPRTAARLDRRKLERLVATGISSRQIVRMMRGSCTQRTVEKVRAQQRGVRQGRYGQSEL